MVMTTLTACWGYITRHNGQLIASTPLIIHHVASRVKNILSAAATISSATRVSTSSERLPEEDFFKIRSNYYIRWD